MNEKLLHYCNERQSSQTPKLGPYTKSWQYCQYASDCSLQTNMSGGVNLSLSCCLFTATTHTTRQYKKLKYLTLNVFSTRQHRYLCEFVQCSVYKQKSDKHSFDTNNKNNTVFRPLSSYIVLRFAHFIETKKKQERRINQDDHETLFHPDLGCFMILIHPDSTFFTVFQTHNRLVSMNLTLEHRTPDFFSIKSSIRVVLICNSKSMWKK